MAVMLQIDRQEITRSRNQDRLVASITIICLLSVCLALPGCSKKSADLAPKGGDQKPSDEKVEAKGADATGDKRASKPDPGPALPSGFESSFMLPDAEKDQQGNPVVTRDGSKSDQQGLPFEIWLKQPRMEFVLVPAGEFMMGSPDSVAGQDYTEGPVHRVTFTKPFYMAKYEVTQGQWEAVMGANPSYFKNAGKDAPVEQVSWDDCQAFCKKTGLSLPTEAQWEYACRAGTATAIYTGNLTIRGQCNGPELDPIAWYSGNSGVTYEGGYDSSGWSEKQYNHSKAGTHPVGKKKANAWGLYDMIGNVWEWCEDNWHDNYQGAPADGSAWLGGSTVRVIRGGGWDNDARYCRAAVRIWYDPGLRGFYIGFRPLRPLP